MAAFRTRATARIENVTARKKGIVVTELPYNVGPEKVIEKISDLVKSKKLQGISDIADLTDGEHGLQVVIEIKNGFHPEAILEQLYRLTPMEDSFSINNVTLVDGQPRTLGLRELLEVYVAHRLDVVRRRSEYRRRKAQERAHIVEGLLIALDAIDDVIHIIRSSADVRRGACPADRGLRPVRHPGAAHPRHAAAPTDRSRGHQAARRAGRARTPRSRTLTRSSRTRRCCEPSCRTSSPRSRRSTRTAAPHGAAGVLPARPRPAPPCRWRSPTTRATSCCRPPGCSPAPPTTPPLAGGAKRAKHDVVVSAVRTTARGEVGVVTSQGRVVRLSALDLPSLPRRRDRSLAGRWRAAERVRGAGAGERGAGAHAARCRRTAPLALGTAQGVVKRVVPEVLTNKDSWEVIGLKDGDEVVGAVTVADRRHRARVRHERRPVAALRGLGGAAAGPLGRRHGRDPARRRCPCRVLRRGPGRRRQPVVVTVSGSYDALPGTEPGAGKVTAFAEYPGKGRGTGGVRCHRLLKGEDGLIFAWAGAARLARPAASGVAVDLPEATGKRDGSGLTLTQRDPRGRGPHRAATRCAVTSELVHEPMAGTAPEARSWLLLEQSGPWGRQALLESRLDPEIGGALAFRTHDTGVKPLLVRRPGKHADHHAPAHRAAWIAHVVPGRTWIAPPGRPRPERPALPATSPRSAPATSPPSASATTSRCCWSARTPSATSAARSGAGPRPSRRQPRTPTGCGSPATSAATASRPPPWSCRTGSSTAGSTGAAPRRCSARPTPGISTSPRSRPDLLVGSGPGRRGVRALELGLDGVDDVVGVVEVHASEGTWAVRSTWPTAAPAPWPFATSPTTAVVRPESCVKPAVPLRA